MKTKFLALLAFTFFLNSCAPFFRVINFTPSKKIGEINFTQDPPNQEYDFFYSDTTGHEYLRTLRQEYKLDSITEGKIEFEQIKAILHWSHTQWEHNGNNTPTKNDALSILKEAHEGEGKQFRCVEYGILAAACLNSIAIPSRVLALKSRDVEKIKFGAGHVVTETYSSEYNKWIFIDPQFDLIPMLDETPLNGVELQHAIIHNREKIELINQDGSVEQERSEWYINWIGKYLYHFDVGFDQREGTDIKYKKFNGNSKLMLVPVGVENPTVFQRKYDIKSCTYTNSVLDFYRKPNS